MKTLYLKAPIAILFLSVYLIACDAPTNSATDSNQGVITSMDELKVPANFNWKTQKDITFKLRGYETALVQFISKDGTEYHRANLIDNNEYSFELTVPAFMEQITVTYMGQQIKFDLNRSEIAHTFKP